MKKKYFIGKRALEAELDRGSEWEFVGIDIQWTELEDHYRRLVLHQDFLAQLGEPVRHYTKAKNK